MDARTSAFDGFQFSRGMRVWGAALAAIVGILGIAFGLSSARVVGAAREIHVVLVPLAAIGLAMLAWRRVRRP